MYLNIKMLPREELNPAEVAEAAAIAEAVRIVLQEAEVMVVAEADTK